MKIHVAIVSSVVVSFLWLSPLVAHAKDQKQTTAPLPHGECVSDCETGYNKCRAASPNDGAALKAC